MSAAGERRFVISYAAKDPKTGRVMRGGPYEAKGRPIGTPTSDLRAAVRFCGRPAARLVAATVAGATGRPAYAVPVRTRPDALRRAVAKFHRRFGFAVRTTPAVPTPEEVRFRLRLITEEYFELLAAASPGMGPVEAMRDLAERMVDALAIDPAKVDLVAFADATIDLDWVVEGTRATFGLPGAALLREVAQANMRKGPGVADGKPVKGAAWVPPDIAGVLRAHGWRT